MSSGISKSIIAPSSQLDALFRRRPTFTPRPYGVNVTHLDPAGEDVVPDVPDDVVVDSARLAAWLQTEWDRYAPVRVERMGLGVGVANALFDVVWGDERFVLRRPPALKVTASAGQTMREARVLGALEGTDVPHPRLIAVCEDPTVIGAPFLLMERIEGFTAVDPLSAPLLAHPQGKHALGMELIDGLARLARVDWQAVGLDGFGKPDGFLARQVDRWLWQLDSYRIRDIPGETELVGWLRERCSEPGPIGIMHGDYSNFNVMYSYDVPPKLAAIVDWDTATIGEVLMDLGHVLSRFDEAGEEPTYLGSTDIADRTGMATRAELANRYAELTGFDLTHLDYYQVLSLFKLGCILEGHYARALAMGVLASDDRRPNAAPALFRDALRITQGERR
jgi:aminoglycoside phosphotransferase (APT) family kinase protein